MENVTLSSITQHTNTWSVAGPMVVDTVNKLLLESAKFTNNESAFEVNFSKVTDVDTAALSLMMEWQRRAVALNKKVVFTHLPANLTSLASLYGVTEFILMVAS